MITAWLQKLSIPTRFEKGLRVTDTQTLEVVGMVLCGQINQELVALGVANAVALTARLLEENLTERIAADLARFGAETLRTPGKAAAAMPSMCLIRACAWGLRTTAI